MLEETSEQVAEATEPQKPAEVVESAPTGEDVTKTETAEEMRIRNEAEVKKASQERFDTVTSDKYNAIQEAGEEIIKREAADARIIEIEAAKVTLLARPDRSVFETEDAYQEALIDWKFETKIQTERENEAKRIAKANEDRTVTERQTKFDTFVKRVEKAKETIPDIQEALRSVIATPTIIEVLHESEFGPELAYHLSKNSDMAMKIASMSPVLAARELNKLEFSIAASKKTKTVSNAPEPINPLGGGGKDLNPENESTEDYIRRRNKELYGK